MVHITKTNQGDFIGISAARILGNRNPSGSVQANMAVRTLFSRFLMDLHSSAKPGSTVAEILLANEEGRVVPYVILRQRGEDGSELNRSLTGYQDSLLEALQEAGFQIQTLDSEQEFTGFARGMGKTDCRSVLAVSKKEIRCAEMFYAGGIYCADVVRSAGDQEIARVTEALSRQMGSVISLQLIPTRYDQTEKDALQQAKRKLSYVAASGRQTQGADRMQRALELYSLLERGPLFCYNFLIYSSPEGSQALAESLMECMESAAPEDRALETVDLSACGLRPDKRIASSPWAVNQLLTQELRKQKLWNAEHAPQGMIRLKYLMSGGEAMGVFRLPLEMPEGAAAVLPEEEATVAIRKDKTAAVWPEKEPTVSAEGAEPTVWPEKEPTASAEKAEPTAWPEKEPTASAEKAEPTAWPEKEQEAAAASAAPAEEKKLLLGTISGQEPLRLGMKALAEGLLAAGPGREAFIRGLLRQAWKVRKIPFLAMEPAGCAYRSLAADIPELRIYTPCRDRIAPLAYNPFALPKGVTVRTHAQGITEVFAAVYKMTQPQEDVFSRAVLECYRRYGWKPESTWEEPAAEPFGLHEFILVYSKFARSKEYEESCLGLKSRFERLMGQDGPVFDTVHGVDLEELLASPAVIELEEISCRVHKMLLIGLLARAAAEFDKEKVQRIWLLEEANWLPAGLEFSGALVYGAEADISRPFRNRLDFDAGQATFHGKDVAAPVSMVPVGFAPEETVSDERIIRRDQTRPYRECGHCDGCQLDTRENSGFAALQLLDEYIEDLETEQDLLRFLVQMEEILERRGIEAGKVRSCVKIQLLRKAMLEGNYRFSQAEYQTILAHPAFLRREGGRQDE